MIHLVLVVYYSRKGHVKAAAEDYAKKHNCELLEIKDTVNRNGFLGFINAGRQSGKKMATPIEPIDKDFTCYEKIILCTPVWAGNCACGIRTFLKTFGSQINEMDYVIMSGGRSEHQSIIDDLDKTWGKKHTNAYCIIRGERID